MKKETKEALERAILGKKVKYKNFQMLYMKFIDLYQKYLTEEVDSVDKLFEIVQTKYKITDIDLEYMNFLGKYLKDIKVSRKAIKESGANDKQALFVNQIINSVSQFKVTKANISESQKFVNIVNEVFDERISLLDVGSGSRFPVSSLQFLESGNKVTTMDEFHTFWNSFELFEKLGLNVKSEYFYHDTDISTYDVIVGNSPCKAIIPIVETCADKEDKEYLIRMCDCCSPRGGMTGFVEYLKEKDSNLRCFVERHGSDVEKQEFFMAKDEELSCWDEVFVTNSRKHSDDIMQVIYDNLKTKEENQM